MHRSFKFALLFALSSGVLMVLVFPKFNLSPLSAVALVPLLLATVKEPVAWRRFIAGTLGGCVFFAGTCYWIYGVMRNYGGLGVAASAGVFVLFFLTLALYWGLFSALAAYLWGEPLPLATPAHQNALGTPATTPAHRNAPGTPAGRGSARAWGPFAIPFLWVALECARAHLLSGFPWLLLGYALTDYWPVARLARWTGIYGLSFLVMALNVAWVWLLARPGKMSAGNLGGVVGIILLLAIGGARESYPENQKAYLVQPNIPQEVAFERWDEVTQAPLLARLKALTLQATGRQEQPSLVIWPETPAAFYFNDDAFARLYARSIARESNSYFLMGIVAYAPGADGKADKTKPLNSEVLLSPEGDMVSRYDKIHLVPFGEYVPLKRWLTFAEKLTAEVSDFVPGNQYVVSHLRGGSMAGVICYEAIFPDLVGRFVKNGAEVLVNTSNDGWYGSSAARYQHLLMARMRAIENARYLLRATNTGITVAIRPDGRIASELPADKPGVLESNWGFLKDQTFYSRHGDVFAIAACIIAAAALLAVAGSRGIRMVRERTDEHSVEASR